ncbi:unnamed protein product [Acanthoscelides obtectus]|uniref:DNA primase large subunit n=2 Tax=Acanthoscelides obtectus TaxID=200917 RepID=A0A9P0KPC6_ACAOB|nr:unnamed protein product [Acanthoscelides obtectus]CAK1657795.1 Probable DNA primase large subunit [Acanthoscelides obtectus]
MLSSVSLYNVPPNDKGIQLSQLETIINDRMQLYQILEMASIRKGGLPWEQYIMQQIRHYKLQNYIDLLEDCIIFVDKVQTCWRDEMAHWILLLFFCQSQELRELFIKRETEWLVLRYKNASAEDLNLFLEENHFDFPEVSQAEKKQFEKEFASCNYKRSRLAGNFHKTHWSNVQKLVTLRKVFLHKGMAYFPKELLVYAVQQHFQERLNKKLTWARRVGIRDERIYHLKPIMPVVTSKSFNIPIEVTTDNVDTVAEQHYPLCMLHLHNYLRRNHHLKYDCKMQLGIFLKWVGMPYEDMLVFWKEEFTQVMTEEKYEKEYVYLFKHQYGKVGSKLQYKPYTCERIQSFTPAVNQEHGCPFKHWDQSSLSAKLEEELGGDYEQLQDIEDLVREKHYVGACNKYLCYKNPAASSSEPIASPNEYVQKSMLSDLYGVNEVKDCLDTLLDTL